MNGYNCYGSSCGSGQRSFLTKEEKIEMLKEYKKDLENEVQGVSERIVEMSKSK